jgi:enoyl-CoA hydratase/carnithine racemase
LETVKDSAPLLYERIADHIIQVTINRPGAGNSINGAVATGICDSVRKSEADESVWVVILTGAGVRSFCGGADLKEVAAGNRQAFSTQEGGFGGLVQATRTKPWIAAVNAAAVGGGTELALACDMIVVAAEAYFALAEVKRGIVPGAGGAFRLPRAIPKAVALELLATGAPLSAQRALAFGMVNRVVPQGSVLEEAMRLASDICANAPISVRETLRVARASLDLNESELFALSQSAGDRNRLSEDYKEGPRVFLEKRAPHWKGR